MRIHWKYLAVTLVIGWFLGAASGLVGTHFCRQWTMYARHTHRMRRRFYKELKLTPDQVVKVDTIIDASHQQVDRIFIETKPKVEEVRNSTRAQIRQLLTPEQQATFDKREEKMRDRFEKRFDSIHDQWH